MDYETITVDQAGHIATITLNRPEKMNALNAQMRAELTDAVKTAAAKAKRGLLC